MYLNLYLQYLSDGGERREGTGHKFASDGKGVLGCGGDSSGSGVHSLGAGDHSGECRLNCLR